MKKLSSFLIVAFFVFFTQNLFSQIEPTKEKLSFTFMNLQEVKLDSSQIPFITELDLSGNPFSELPDILSKAEKLKVLRLNFCRNLNVKTLVAVIQKLQLEELELNNCNFTYIPYEIANIRSLKKISLQHNFIQEIPWNLYYNSNLVSLNLAYNDIDQLSEDAKLFQNLNELNISYNPLLKNNSWCNIVGVLSNLHLLDCSGAASLPEDWQLPNNLNTLALNNCTAKFPNKISGYDSLTTLTIENYEREDFEKVLNAFNVSNLNSLHVSGDFIKNIPDALANCTRLENFDIKCNSLNNITEKLAALSSLQKVHAIINDSASLAGFIKSLGNAKTLTALDLQGNHFVNLPEEIKYLKSLQKLEVQNTGLQFLNETLLKNQGLKEIDLRENKINKENLTALIQNLPNANIYYDQINPLYVPYIQKPFPQITIAPEVFTCDPKKDTTIITKNGTQINIPANSIVDKNQKPLKERVQLSYTTYYNPLEIYLSGIPMHSDSAGIQRDFASAGMFTLNAKTASNKAAYINKNLPLTVNFVSSSPNKSYNYYYLDTIKRDWVQTGNDNLAKGDNLKRKLTKTYPRMPNNPYKILSAKIEVVYQKKSSPRKPTTFSLRIIANEAEAKKQKKDSAIYYDPQEVNVFKKYKWIYVGDSLKTYQDIIENGKTAYFSDHSYNKSKKEFYSTSKENIEINISPNYKKDCFVLTFYNGNDSISIDAIPEISNRNPVKDQETVKELYKKYEEQRKVLTPDRKIRYEKFKKDYRDYAIRMQNYNKLARAYTDRNVSPEAYQKLYEQIEKNDLDSLMKNAPTLASITRSLALTNFGTYNCDYFFRVKDPVSSSPQFVDAKSSVRLRVNEVTLIDLDENAFIQTKPSEIKLAKNHNYWLFTQTNDLQTGFAEVAADNKPFNKIPVKAISANSVADLRRQLKY